MLDRAIPLRRTPRNTEGATTIIGPPTAFVNFQHQQSIFRLLPSRGETLPCQGHGMGHPWSRHLFATALGRLANSGNGQSADTCAQSSHGCCSCGLGHHDMVADVFLAYWVVQAKDYQSATLETRGPCCLTPVRATPVATAVRAPPAATPVRAPQDAGMKLSQACRKSNFCLTVPDRCEATINA